MEEFRREINSRRKRLDPEENLRIHKEKKAHILSSLEILITRERALKPDFNLTHESIRKFLKEDRKMFPKGINTSQTLLSYFGDSINHLREKFKLPLLRLRKDEK